MGNFFRRPTPPKPPIPDPAVIAARTETITAIYDEELGRPVDAAGLADYLRLCAIGATAETIRADVRTMDEFDDHWRWMAGDLYRRIVGRDPTDQEAQAIVDRFHAQPVDVISPATLAIVTAELEAQRPVPTLVPWTISGTAFYEVGQLRKWHGCTAFRLYQLWLDGTDIRPFLRWAPAQDINILRVLMMQAWVDRPFLPSAYGDRYYGEFPVFLDVVHSEGLRCEIVALADCVDRKLPDGTIVSKAVLPTEEAQRAHLARLYAIMTGGPDLLEDANEPFKNGVVPRYVAHAVPGLLQASGQYDFTDPSTLVLNYVTVHSPRDAEWPRKAKDLIEISVLGWGGFTPLRCPAVGDEPMGIGSGNGRSLTPADFGDYAAVADLFGAGSTIHGDFGIECRIPTEAEQACVDAYRGSWAAIPPEAQFGHYTAGHLSECPLVFDPNTSLRIFAMIYGSSATVVVVRPTSTFRVTPVSGWAVEAQKGHVIQLRRT